MLADCAQLISAKCEPEDLPPQKIYVGGCVSKDNVTMNYCVSKNGACTAMDGSALDYGYMTGVSALFDEFHVVSFVFDYVGPVLS